MKAARALLAILVALNALVIATVIGYTVGSESGRKSVECEEGLVLSVDVSGADALGNGATSLNIGDCERIDVEAFNAAVEALTGRRANATTTTTTTTTTTIIPKPTS